MIKADVLITNKNWKKYITAPDLYIKKKLKKLEKKTNLFKKNNYSFTILLSGDLEVKKLNIKFRKKNKTTDILSFPFHQKKFLNKLLKKNKIKIYLGDIIINLNKIKYFKKNENFPLNFDKIWVHGLAHLLGHRHKSNFDYFIMKKLENTLLQSVI
jgi:probable rRNA maturation factor